MRELMRQKDIVGVQEDDVVAAREAEPEVTRSALAAVRVIPVLGVAHSRRVVGLRSPGDPGAVVSRAIVDEDEIPTRMRLPRDALDGL
jgi:hypothetical protein